jgi:copper transport protein
MRQTLSHSVPRLSTSPRTAQAPLPGAWLALACLAAGILAVPLADAHGVPLNTFPFTSDHFSQSPPEVWADFSETPDPQASWLQVLDRGLHNVVAGEVRVQGNRMSASLLPHLPDGGYRVEWGATSIFDGHLQHGSWTFGVGNVSAFEADSLAAQPVPSASLSGLVVAGKGIAFVGLAMVCGAVATRAYVVPRRAWPALGGRLARFEVAGALLHAAGLALFLAGQGTAQGGVLAYAGGTLFGRGLLLRLGLAMALLGWLLRPRARSGRWGRPIDLALAGTMLAAAGLFSHTAALLHPFPLGAAVDAVHLAAVMAWTGGLACLALLLGAGADAEALAESSQRFSRMATACVAVLSVTGIAMLAALLGVDVRAWPLRLQTPYGALLGAKVLLAAAMMALGALNRIAFVSGRAPRRIADPAPRARFRRGLAREALVGLAVFLLATGVTNLPPMASAGGVTGADVLRSCAGSADTGQCYATALLSVQRQYGSNAAFDVLARMAETNVTANSLSHVIGHDLGSNALSIYGTIKDTIASCSAKVFQACLHAAVQAYLESMPSLNLTVLKAICPPGNPFNTFTCMHGVGHGVMMATRYDLNRTLALCDGLGTANQRQSCLNGAFMEWDDSYMYSVSGVSGETMFHRHDGEGEEAHGRGYANDTHYPCSALSDPLDLRICWLYQPQMILFLNGNNFTAAAADCLSVAPYDRPCLRGVGGLLAGRTGHDAPLVARVCNALASPTATYYCVKGFTQQTIAYLADPVPVLGKCAQMPVANRVSCYYTVGFEGRLMRTAAQMAQVCAQAEAQFRASCQRGVGDFDADAG